MLPLMLGLRVAKGLFSAVFIYMFTEVLMALFGSIGVGVPVYSTEVSFMGGSSVGMRVAWSCVCKMCADRHDQIIVLVCAYVMFFAKRHQL